MAARRCRRLQPPFRFLAAFSRWRLSRRLSLDHGLATLWVAMNRYVRRCTLGAFAGLVCSVVLAVALGNGLVGVVLGTAIGLG